MRPYSIALLTLTALCATAAWSSEGVDDVVKLANAGLSQDVIMAYVQAAPTAYDPTADEIKMLRDKNVSATVIVAMIDHGKEVSGASTGAQAAPLPPANSAPDAQPVSQPAEDYNSAPLNPPSNNPGAPGSDYAADPGAPASGISTTVVAPPPQDANISYFYETLAPHGTWHDTSLGYVWQPNVVSVEAGWRPYANDGHWISTDAGWYWESNYPWGWAAFHYGRWSHDAALGWVWLPDTTWGPAWVSWRHSDAYYGWAPLPPQARFDANVGFSFHDKHVDVGFDFGLGESDFAFVPAGRFLDVNIGVDLVPHDRVREVFPQTTIVKNTYVYNDNRVINAGIPQSEVVRSTGRRIETVRITNANYAAGAAIRGEVRSRNSIAVFRPALSNAAPRTPAAAIARGTYVRRDVVYRHVTQETDRAAERRLTTELSRRSVRPEEVTRHAATPQEQAAQRRLDSEIAQREHARSETERAKVQQTMRERDVRGPNTETALRRDARQEEVQQQRESIQERRTEHAPQAREEAASKHDSRDEAKDSRESKKKHGHDD